MNKEISTAVSKLNEVLRTDREYYNAWQANIAIQFIDAYREEMCVTLSYDVLHKIANDAAKNFLDLLIKEEK